MEIRTHIRRMAAVRLRHSGTDSGTAFAAGRLLATSFSEYRRREALEIVQTVRLTTKTIPPSKAILPDTNAATGGQFLATADPNKKENGNRTAPVIAPAVLAFSANLLKNHATANVAPNGNIAISHCSRNFSEPSKVNTTRETAAPAARMPTVFVQDPPPFCSKSACLLADG